MTTIQEYIQKITLPDPSSHKGQNGKLMIIGGSELFHAASKWSLDVASKFVDMVFYSSVPSNNLLVKEAKQQFWNGIVVERTDIESYIDEADCILIGPGMARTQFEKGIDFSQPPTAEEWQSDTQKIVNYLVSHYPQKKWVIDAGALQMISPELLGSTTIITPHSRELERVLGMMPPLSEDSSDVRDSDPFKRLLNQGVTVVVKGPTDFVYFQKEVVEVSGGNAGMTKGGTGDVLAGLIAALYCTNSSDTAAVVGSYVNKKAGEKLAESVGPFFNASDLVTMVPQVLWNEWTTLHPST